MKGLLNTHAWSTALLLVLAGCVTDTSPTPPAPANDAPSNNAQDGKTDTIFGDNDRVDTVNHPSELLRRAARSSAALVFDFNLEHTEDGVKIHTEELPSLGTQHNLCEEEPFREQPLLSTCSAWLAAPDLVVTNAHCLPEPTDCASTSIVFDYMVDKDGKAPGTLPKESVYHCNRVLAWDHSERCAVDYAVIQLDRNVTGRQPLPLRTAGGPTSSQSLAAIGHPFGLPQKIAGNGALTYNKRTSFATTNDIIEGSSGSPLLNEATGVVDGMTTCGELNPLVPDTEKGCNNERVCEGFSTGCTGISNVRTTLFADMLGTWHIEDRTDYIEIDKAKPRRDIIGTHTETFEVTTQGRVTAVSVYAEMMIDIKDAEDEIIKSGSNIILRKGNREMTLFDEGGDHIVPLHWHEVSIDDGDTYNEAYIRITLPEAFEGEDAKGTWEVELQNFNGDETLEIRTLSFALAIDDQKPTFDADKVRTHSSHNAQVLESQGGKLHDTLTVAGSGTVGQLWVQLDIDNAPHDNLVVTLTSPGGDTFEITNPQITPGGLNLSIPAERSDFRGIEAAGQWQLDVHVFDDLINERFNLQSWSLQIEHLD